MVGRLRQMKWWDVDRALGDSSIDAGRYKLVRQSRI